MNMTFHNTEAAQAVEILPYGWWPYFSYKQLLWLPVKGLFSTSDGILKYLLIS